MTVLTWHSIWVDVLICNCQRNKKESKHSAATTDVANDVRMHLPAFCVNVHDVCCPTCFRIVVSLFCFKSRITSFNQKGADLTVALGACFVLKLPEEPEGTKHIAAKLCLLCCWMLPPTELDQNYSKFQTGGQEQGKKFKTGFQACVGTTFKPWVWNRIKSWFSTF